jgi:hypothetical protein
MITTPKDLSQQNCSGLIEEIRNLIACENLLGFLEKLKI